MRKAFTLIELLVVISIIGMLAGLLLPAVQQAREAGRRATCINNQKNVALGVSNYESGRGGMPGLTSKLTSGNWISWPIALFPYIEETNLYDAIQNVSTNVVFFESGDLTNLTAPGGGTSDQSQHRVPIYQCPSAGVSGARMVSVANCGPMNLNKDYSRALGTAYAGLAVGDAFEPGTESSTIFFERRNGGYKDTASSRYTQTLDYISMKNGTSHTILTTENVNAGNWYDFSEPQIGFCYSFVAGDTDLNSNSALDPLTVYWNGTDSGDSGVYAAKINMYRNAVAGTGTPPPPNYGTHFGAALTDKTPGIYRIARPSSNHPGLVIAAFCDGSARQISETVEQKIFVWAMQPNSGQVVSGL